MKLWVWNDVLEDYTSGIAFALGDTPEAARRAVIEKFVEDECWGYAKGSEQYRRLRESVQQAAEGEFAAEPVEMAAGYCYGGG